ncbi:MAG: exopolysaccharide biosynthesis protein, partial [Youngiibacter sp.]|nr:exopolysaccharide biosynthesis protein [Youngiibacter sp.]
MLDVHSHVLPGLDDGARDLETSYEMIRKCIQEGTDGIIVTPHYAKGRYEVGYDTMLENMNTLKESIRSMGLEIELYPGQEITLDNSAVELYRNGTVRG